MIISHLFIFYCLITSVAFLIVVLEAKKERLSIHRGQEDRMSWLAIFLAFVLSFLWPVIVSLLCLMALDERYNLDQFKVPLWVDKGLEKSINFLKNLSLNLEMYYQRLWDRLP